MVVEVGRLLKVMTQSEEDREGTQGRNGTRFVSICSTLVFKNHKIIKNIILLISEQLVQETLLIGCIYSYFGQQNFTASVL